MLSNYFFIYQQNIQQKIMLWTKLSFGTRLFWEVIIQSCFWKIWRQSISSLTMEMASRETGMSLWRSPGMLYQTLEFYLLWQDRDIYLSHFQIHTKSPRVTKLLWIWNIFLYMLNCISSLPSFFIDLSCLFACFLLFCFILFWCKKDSDQKTQLKWKVLRCLSWAL